MHLCFFFGSFFTCLAVSVSYYDLLVLVSSYFILFYFIVIPYKLVCFLKETEMDGSRFGGG